MEYIDIIRDLIVNSDLDIKDKILEYFDSLLDDLDWLSCLEAAGVDNWSGIDVAREIQQEMKEE